MGQMGLKSLGPPAPNVVGGLKLPVGAAGVVGARAHQGIVLGALSKVDLGKLVEMGLSGMVAAQGVAASPAAAPVLRPVPRAAPGSLMGLKASLPSHPILILLGGEKSGWDKRH